jgi:hypothetical protein
MPAIDLARLRKQTNRLVDFFFLPEEFMKHLRGILEFYVNNTLRTKENVAPGSVLTTYHTPPAVLTQIQNSLREAAEGNPQFALSLADVLWEESALETRLLAAYLLGRVPPEEESMLPRLSAWIQQVRDPRVRSALLTTSMDRMRMETPRKFLELMREFLHPARLRSWSDGLHALLPMISDADHSNLPPLFDLLEPVLREAPSSLQDDLREIILALYRASARETTFMLKQLLVESQNPMTWITMRRISHTFPLALQDELRELIQSGSHPASAQVFVHPEGDSSTAVNIPSQAKRKSKQKSRKPLSNPRKVRMKS